jgi:rod shape-determining protein MreC
VRTNTRRIFKVLAAIAFLVVLVASSKTITSRTRANISDTANSPLATLHSILSNIKKIIPFASFRKENKALRDRIDLLNRRIAEMSVVYEENERLKDFIDFKKSLPYLTVPAQVIGRDPTNWSNSIIINKGANDGVRQGRAVLSAGGLVGRVLETGRRSGRVLLITDPNSKVGVIIQRNRQGGILVGRPDGRCKMIYISLDSDVAPGDKVITAGFGEIFPKDVLIGEVASVGKEPGRLYKYAIVKTAEDMSRLEEVLCIK